LLAGWLAVKLVFVLVILPTRRLQHQPRPGGEMLARLVPADEMLYLFRLKDEGLLFYSGHRAKRLPSPDALPAETVWCLLTETEWRAWQGRRPTEVLPLRDEQGSSLVLVHLPARQEKEE
jgi:hypothetical protein